MELELSDLLVVVFYIVFVVFIGFRTSKQSLKKNSAEDFILAGRKITLPFFIASLVATWYGNILGYGEFVYTGGLVSWVSFGLPYYIAAILFALILAKKIRMANVTTIPEQISLKYGKHAGNLSSVIILVITVPAAYILMLSILIQLFTGWSLNISVIFGTLLSLIYLFTGGFRASVYTNSLQFIFMYLGFGALLYFSFVEFGSISSMLDQVPQEHKTITGPFTWQYVAAWYIIAFQTFVDPSFHQRCSSADTPETARRGVLISVIFWILFDALQLLTGFYARAFVSVENALMAYPVLGDIVLPPIWKGIFLTALLAVIMSTIDSYAFLSGSTIGNDLMKPFLKRFKLDLGPKRLTQIGLLITAVIAVIMAINVPSVVNLIYLTSSVAVPGLIFPLSLSMSSKYYLKQNHAIAIMLFSSLISAFWIVMSSLGTNFFVSLEPMFPGIILAAILTLIFIKKQ
jgi:SSS family solute:Na+ symporter